MSDASQQPADRPRTWFPLVGAAAAAVVVLAIALSTMAFGDKFTETEEATIGACEAAYATADGEPIVGGSIYVPAQMSDYYAVAETHGTVPEPLEDVPAEVLAEWDAAGERWVDSGDGPVVLVWRHEDDTYTQCTVEFVGNEIVENSAQLGPLEVAARR